jgi:hypothetical protein
MKTKLFTMKGLLRNILFTQTTRNSEYMPTNNRQGLPVRYSTIREIIMARPQQEIHDTHSSTDDGQLHGGLEVFMNIKQQLMIFMKSRKSRMPLSIKQFNFSAQL